MLTGSFFLDVIRKDHRYASTNVISDLSLLEPGTRAAVTAIIADAKAQGHTLKVLETYRSQARQHMLFTEGKTELSRVGVHGYGLACDLGLMIDGKYDPKGQNYSFLVSLGGKHKMISGVDWGLPKLDHSFRDWDHVQRIPLFRQDALFAGEWYPAEDFDPYADMAANHINGV